MWEILPLGEAVKPTRPRIKPAEKPHLPFIGMENIEAHTMKLLGTVPAVTMKSSAVHFQPGDVLYGRLRPYLNKVYRPEFEGLCSAEFIVFPKSEGLDSRYLQYFLNSSAFVSFASNLNTGDRPRVDFEQLAPYPLPVAPPKEQEGIVAEIEKQFSRLDEAIANLKRVKTNLKRYKAAVLKAAVEGKLTEDWRKQHLDVEPASELLERILSKRRARWTGRGKYQEPTKPDSSNLPSLPNGWIWATAEQVCDFITKGTTPKAEKLREVTGDVPFLKVYNLTFTGRLDLTIKPTFVDRAVHEAELGRSKLKMGDVLINIVGPPLGQVAIVPDSLAEANINQAIARFRVLEPVSNHYVAVGLMSETIMGWAIKRAKTTVGQSNLTLELCRALPFPLPPLEEQKSIVSEVERRMSIIEEIETAVEANLTRADRLRQSILSQAFSGHLTNQRPGLLKGDAHVI